MASHHWLMLVLILAIGYFVGARYPGMARQIGM